MARSGRGQLVFIHEETRNEQVIKPAHIAGTIAVLRRDAAEVAAALDGGRRNGQVVLPHDAFYLVLRTSRDVESGLVPVEA